MIRPSKVEGEHGETQPSSDRERILGLTVNTLGRNITWSLAQRTARHGFLPGVNPVIARLMQLTESTQGELSRLIGIEQPTRDGLISRSPDPAHGRRTTIRLTAKGRALSQLMSKAAREVEKMATKGLSAHEVAEFFRIANIMTQNLNAERYGDK